MLLIPIRKKKRNNMKIIRSYIGKEYCGRYTQKGMNINTNMLLRLYSKALKTIVYMLNKITFKVVL